MNNRRCWTVPCTVVAVWWGSVAVAAEPPLAPAEITAPARPAEPRLREKPVAHAPVQTPAPEWVTATTPNAGFNTTSAFAAAAVPAPDSSNLSAPVTITYSGGSPVLQINDSGSNKGVLSQITNSHNGTSALYGITNGGGAGLTGYNNGTAGPAGKFGITNSNSAQPGVFTTTNGSGPALLATVTTATSNEPALLGQNQVSAGYGYGVEGQGNYGGVIGLGGFYGVYGYGTSEGVWGYSTAGDGIYAESSSGDGVYAFSGTGDAVYAYGNTGYGVYAYSGGSYAIAATAASSAGALYASNTSTGNGMNVYSASGTALYGSSTSGYGLRGQSKNTFAVIGEDGGTGVGVYGYSATGLAGWFNGKVQASSYITSSDRNIKTKIHPVDGRAILDKVDTLPVSSWVFKDDPQKNHVGPMAQDFHAAFGLDGADDKHINLTDIAGVSLASIQELSKEMKEKDAEMRVKDAQLADLQNRLKAMNDAFSARITTLEQQQRGLGASTQTAGLKQLSNPIGE